MDISAEQLVLAGLGVYSDGPTGKRLDAGETAVLLKELEYVKSQTYDIKYAPRKGRLFCPVNSEADPAAETIAYDQYDSFGMAKLVSNYADDVPLVGITKKRFTSQVKTLAVGYDWSVLDLMRAARANVPLSQKKAQLAREAVENFLDTAIATGIPNGGLTGMINNANVPIVVLPHTGSWHLTPLSPSQMIANMNHLASQIITTTKENIIPDTLLMDPATFNYIAQTPVAVDNQTTILKSFLANNPYITNVDQWTKLSNAGASSKHRMVCYQRSNMVLEFNLPMDFNQLPPQQKGLSYMVPCWARAAGVEVHYPLGMAYADIATS